MDNLKMSEASAEALLERINAMMRELREMRELVLTLQTEHLEGADIVSRLSGALAPTEPTGLSAEEEYNSISDWERLGDV